MGIQRALTLYPRNDTTVDTGTGIDVRFLSDTQSGSNDITQTITAVNTEDNVEKTWDPATAGVTAVADARALQKIGWGLRLSNDMTPADDTNCDVVIPGQTIAVSMDVAVAWTGTLVASNPNPTFRCVLYKYDPATDTGTAFASWAGLAPSAWNSTLENGTFKTVTFNITSGTFTFATGQILLAQFGLNTGTLPNPLTGTSTYTFTLRIDEANTKLTLASKLAQYCALSTSLSGDGVPTRALAGMMDRSVTGDGVPTSAKATVASKSFDLVGDGVSSVVRAAALDRSMTGDGVPTVSRTVVAAKSFDLVGDGMPTRDALQLAVPRSLVGDGVPTSTKATVAAKSFDLVGDGSLSEVHLVQASRTFDLTGVGTADMTRQVVAAKTFDVLGQGVVSSAKDTTVNLNLTGAGQIEASRVTEAAKTFDLTGAGTITEVHPVQAFRTFDLVGVGEILVNGPNGSTITIPIDEVPTGACPTDWTPNDGLKQITGTVMNHETGDVIAGAQVILVRDSDGLLIASTLTGVDGTYSFGRDTNDPNTYHVEVFYDDGGTQVHGISDRGCAPS